MNQDVSTSVGQHVIMPGPSARAVAQEDRDTQVSSNEFLYMVLVITMVEPHRSFKEYSQTPCTGTLIREDLVLTAASCLKMNSLNELDPTSTQIILRDNRELRCLKIFVHYQYSKSRVYNFAVIVVEKSNINVFPQLPASTSIDFKSILNTCVLGGYGDQHKSISPSKFSYMLLNQTSVDVIKCKDRPGVDDTNRLCLHFSNMQPCHGDVGSPLVCNGEVLALFTPRLCENPNRCVDRYGTVFTQVTAVTDWVNKILYSPSANLEWMNNPWYILVLCATALTVIGSIYYLLMEIMLSHFPMDFEEQPPHNSNDDIRSSGFLRHISDEEIKDSKEDRRWRRI
uniref:Peptidase S1 domain-containing protein n=1 Tax=Graphocephala atropunctata TaxID=36148 RepID=A0A1B6LA86_9HEMI